MLSIIIPVYNGEAFIRDTINGIFSCSSNDIEVIAINDGSTDSSEEILVSISEKDNRLKVYSRDNSGVANSRNFGIEKATGEFIAFVDQDDVIKCHTFEKMIGELERTKSDMAICSSARLLDGEELVLEIQNDNIYRSDEILKSLILPIFLRSFDNPYTNTVDRFFHIWNCLFRRDFIVEKNIRFRSYVNYEDDLLMKIDALSHAEKVVTIKDVGYLWRVNTSSESYAHHFVQQIGERQTRCYEDIKTSLLNTSVDSETMKWIEASIYTTHYLDAMHNLTSKEFKKSRKIICDYCTSNVYERKMDDVAWIAQYAKDGWIRLKVLLPLLIKRQSLRAYYMECIIEKLLNMQVRYKNLFVLEKKIKSINKKK